MSFSSSRSVMPLCASTWLMARKHRQQYSPSEGSSHSANASKTQGFGLIADLVLGLTGSLIGGLLFLAVETSPELGWPTVCVGTFVGAASVIAGQRWWCAHA